jgi:hypothetical protein
MSSPIRSIKRLSIAQLIGMLECANIKAVNSGSAAFARKTVVLFRVRLPAQLPRADAHRRTITDWAQVNANESDDS